MLTLKPTKSGFSIYRGDDRIGAVISGSVRILRDTGEWVDAEGYIACLSKDHGYKRGEALSALTAAHQAVRVGRSRAVEVVQ